MNQFYSNNITDDIATLSESESQHLRVLRLKVGDEVRVVDGQGQQYHGVLSKLHKKASEVTISDVIRRDADRPMIDIAIAPTKSNDRYEWFLEKATEIGVRSVHPFTSYHSERKVIKADRMEKIILSAMKQSLRLWLPQLHPLQSLNQVIETATHEVKYIAHLKTDQHHLKDVADSTKSTLILIGPEGGFSDEEIALAESAGFQSITLGSSRLRTETAGVVASSIFANS